MEPIVNDSSLRATGSQEAQPLSAGGGREPAAADPTTIPPSKEIPAGGHRRNRLSKKRRDRVKRRCVMETRVLKWPDEEVLPL